MMNPTRTHLNILAVAVCIATNTPVLLWGAPGTGKTSSIGAAAVALGRHIETILAALYEPTDFSGLPVVQDDGSVRFAEPAWARRLAESGWGVLFLDEISLAPPAVQSALLRVVLDRVVGELPLGDGVSIVAAANPTDQAVGAFELSAPLANRFCHLEWELDVDTVVAGFSGAWPVIDPELIPAGWTDGVAENQARIGAFLDRRRELCHDLPDDSYSGEIRGWASPRSWEQTARVLAACDAAGLDETVRLVLVSGLVGEGAAWELLAWLDQADLPATDDVLDDPDGVELPSTSDGLWAVLGAVCAVASTRPERWSDAAAVCVRVAATNEDLAVRAAHLLVKSQPVDAAAPKGIGVLGEVLTLSGVALVAA